MKQYKITIITGTGFNGSGRRITKAKRFQAMRAIEKYAVSRFEGLTVYKHKGIWTDRMTQIREEGVTLVVINEHNSFYLARAASVRFAIIIKNALLQNSVMVCVEPIDCRHIVQNITGEANVF